MKPQNSNGNGGYYKKLLTIELQTVPFDNIIKNDNIGQEEMKVLIIIYLIRIYLIELQTVIFDNIIKNGNIRQEEMKVVRQKTNIVILPSTLEL